MQLFFSIALFESLSMIVFSHVLVESSSVKEEKNDRNAGGGREITYCFKGRKFIVVTPY